MQFRECTTGPSCSYTGQGTAHGLGPRSYHYSLVTSSKYSLLQCLWSQGWVQSRHSGNDFGFTGNEKKRTIHFRKRERQCWFLISLLQSELYKNSVIYHSRRSSRLVFPNEQAETSDETCDFICLVTSKKCMCMLYDVF